MDTLYFNCFSGISGDMFIGALIDLGADFDQLRNGLRSLNAPGFDVSHERVKKKGVMATQFHMSVTDADQPHRHLHHIEAIIDESGLPGPVKSASLDTFQRIAEAEAEVHGTTVQKIHFHEVGALDSIADVIGAHLALHLLGNPRIIASPLNTGSGTVKCAHGVMPVPAPATALLLGDAPCYGDGEGELVTPTGAALITQVAARFGPMPALRIEAIGYGSGRKDLPDRPNVLRVLRGKAASEAELPGDTVTVLETHIDDMNPEILPAVLEGLGKQGTKDAFLTPITGKKGRPAQLVTVLCEEAQAADVARYLFQNTTTLGVRMRTERRYCLEREGRSVQTPWGAVRVKASTLDGRALRQSPEYEDCRRLAEDAGVPVLRVYETALNIASNAEGEPG